MNLSIICSLSGLQFDAVQPRGLRCAFLFLMLNCKDPDVIYIFAGLWMLNAVNCRTKLKYLEFIEKCLLLKNVIKNNTLMPKIFVKYWLINKVIYSLLKTIFIDLMKVWPQWVWNKQLDLKSSEL